MFIRTQWFGACCPFFRSYILGGITRKLVIVHRVIEMEVFNELGIDIGYVLLGSIGVILLLFILILVLFGKNRKLNKKYQQFMQGADGKSLEEEFQQKFSTLDTIVRNTKVLNGRMKKIDELLEGTYQKIGVVKYDAFKEMGGKLSFAMALLTNKNDGFILNCMHSSREGCYTYIKEIIKGESFVILAEEEKEALEIAMNSNGDIEV